jgi:hypothetical protein
MMRPTHRTRFKGWAVMPVLPRVALSLLRSDLPGGVQFPSNMRKNYNKL